jgi:hypothetical protein
MATERKPRGRPPKWATQITAPAPALELYALIARLAKTPDAFATCHIFHGANLDGTPVIKWQNSVHKLPFVVASYLGLPSAARRCTTDGCCNPFHYLPTDMDGQLLTTGHEKREEMIQSGLADWVDLIDYELDKRMLRVLDVTFDQVREWIPQEDLTDEQLRDALKNMKGE